MGDGAAGAVGIDDCLVGEGAGFVDAFLGIFLRGDGAVSEFLLDKGADGAAVDVEERVAVDR
ncbi:MAG: hypothetical protein EA425_01855 [Puniceicoccaceae bacterium]|nr:MAG: hypothetical protein EA425_01855 [Puniceicoccaceae bacterium]